MLKKIVDTSRHYTKKPQMDLLPRVTYSYAIVTRLPRKHSKESSTVAMGEN